MEIQSPPSIVEEFVMGNFVDSRPVEERYYTKYYHCDKENGDYTFLVHSNKLCLIKLAQSHPIIVKNLTVKAVDFKVSDQLSRLDNHVVGKNKKGAQLLNNTSTICTITCEEQPHPFILKACMVSKLLEVNPSLVTKPELIKSEFLGYIAIISRRVKDHAEQIGHLLNADQYHQMRQEL